MDLAQAMSGSHVADILRGVAVPMRDGCALAADVYLGAGPRPVVLERTPYGRNRCDQSEQGRGMDRPRSRPEVAEAFVGAGFAYVIQDCRGCGGSGGRFAKYLQEPEDGADTIAWIRAQPWCDGRVAMVGFSYGAACQVAAASLGPPGLAAMVADCGGFSDAHRSGIRQGGALDLKQATWAHAQAVRGAKAAGDLDAAARLEAEDVAAWLARGPWAPGHSPLAAARDHERNLSSFWRAGAFGPFWTRPGLYAAGSRPAMARTATLFVSSWFDTSLMNTIDNFQGVAAVAGGRPPQLVIGPWSHGNRHLSHAGEADFGAAALPETGLGADMLDLRAAWLRDALAGTGNGARGPAVRWFEMGGGTGARGRHGRIDHGGRWRAGEAWPPPGAREAAWYLAGGALRAQEPPKETRVHAWTSDPDAPVPTCGGAINSGEPVMAGGMFDQNRLFPVVDPDGPSPLRAGRPDVLVFMTPPLERDLVVAGPVRARLWIVADAPDADVTIKLVDCYPDGPAVNLADGILRLRYRESRADPVPLPEGRPVRVEVEAFPTANRFRAGHRIRLDVAASNFPHFDVNPQTGAPEGEPGPRAKARLALATGPDTPSCLLLYLVEEPS
ncbi:CocE/NonD family hydrolase [Arenibaculum sp.]|jgi:hypothetical protein|uniref:CocE/NonD family hydrolase n=1 Tax=Arenibaculum sp. TaxID=2865862 RepID=UPI002E141EB9|nr:CocE/NonD family hydrolase [Arenibaculum sp.]